jgi:7-cyano-7-deazaguanine synthase in queuosine biosynthesis
MSTQSPDQIQEDILYTSPNEAMRFLNEKRWWRERDLLMIGSAIFNLETALKRRLRVDKIAIPLSRETLVRIDPQGLGDDLSDLILGVLFREVEVVFKPAPPRRRRSPRPIDWSESDTVCLFSGGVDSYSGLLSSLERYENLVGVSVIHGDQPWASHILDRVTGRILCDANVEFHTLFAPRMLSHGYSQLRGFLYCLYGGIYMSLVKARTLLITEVGPTMYQPRFSPYDAVTMTTHPFVLKKVKRILTTLLDREVSLVLPHENMTKAEVVAISGLKDGLPLTHSCVSLRFGKNDGCCYGCVARRLGFLVAGVRDADYTFDPLGRNGGNADNISNLLRFSLDVLTDFPDLLSSSKDIIEDFGKRDLFKRFALDTFAGLYVYQTEVGPLNPSLKALYQAGVIQLGTAKFEKRISKVRRPTFRPNFLKLVK